MDHALMTYEQKKIHTTKHIQGDLQEHFGRIGRRIKPTGVEEEHATQHTNVVNIYNTKAVWFMSVWKLWYRFTKMVILTALCLIVVGVKNVMKDLKRDWRRRND